MAQNDPQETHKKVFEAIQSVNHFKSQSLGKFFLLIKFRVGDWIEFVRGSMAFSLNDGEEVYKFSKLPTRRVKNTLAVYLEGDLQNVIPEKVVIFGSPATDKDETKALEMLVVQK